MPTLPALTSRRPATRRSNCMCVWPRRRGRRRLRRRGSDPLRGSALREDVDVVLRGGVAVQDASEPSTSSVSSCRTRSQLLAERRPRAESMFPGGEPLLAAASARGRHCRAASGRGRRAHEAARASPTERARRTTSPPTTIARVVRNLREDGLERRQGCRARRRGPRRRQPMISSWSLRPASARRRGRSCAVPARSDPGGRSPCRRRPPPRAAGGRASRRRSRPPRPALRPARRRAGARARRAARPGYAMPFAFSSRATGSVGCAPFDNQALTFSSSNSMRDGSCCGL